MKIIYTNHAIQRLAERGITIKQVEETVLNQDALIKRRNKSEALKEFNEGVLKVVYTKKEQFIIIITIHWM